MSRLSAAWKISRRLPARFGRTSEPIPEEVPVNARLGLRLVCAIASLTFVSACGDTNITSPSARQASESGVSAPPPALQPTSQSLATGAIEMASSSPASGASLSVRSCQFGAVTRSCAAGWVGTFNVSLSRELRYPVLTVAFYSGNVLCGYAADIKDRITAGQTVTFRPTWISLSDEFGTFLQACTLPATTTRMVAVLWSDDDWTTQIRQEFATAYRFVRP
jgi:hypothetical protein